MQRIITYKNQSWIDWITMILLIANTANSFFYQSVEMLFLSFVVLLALWFIKEGDRTKLNSYFWIYVAILTCLQACQSLVYHMFPLKTFLGEYLRIALAVLAICILGQRFFDQFVKFVYVFAVISLFFYIPCMLVKSLGPFLVQHVAKHMMSPFSRGDIADFYASHENMIIFNLGQIDLHRNSGFYWEPGTHGGFLVLALFINLFYRKEKWTSRINMVFLFTIMTTLSTTTYLAVFFVVLASLKEYFIKRPWISFSLLLIIAGGAVLLYNKLDFLNKKIDQQIEKSDKGVAGESRFGSLLTDIHMVSEHPLIGTGRNMEMKFGKNVANLPLKLLHRNNGIGVLLSTYGILFFFYFFYLNWLGFFKLLGNKTNATLLLVLLLIIGFSEDYFFKAFFIALPLYCGITVTPMPRIVILRSNKLRLGKTPLIYEYH